jgi:hypothetical protein
MKNNRRTKFLGNRYLVLLFVLLANPVLMARSWTDKDGRVIEAEIVSADVDKVIVNKGGKEFKLPLDRLSEGDQEFVKNWLEEQGDEEAEEKKPDEVVQGGAAGGLIFDGKPLVVGGKTNLYEYDYSELQLKNSNKFKGKSKGYKIAMAVPAGFDPAKPQKVFIVCTAENNAQQILAGNVGMMSFFAKQCVESGWVCLAYDTNIGRENQDSDLMAAFLKINSIWPEFKGWSFAVGGFSGGAKACFTPCAYLLKNDYNVTGAFLAGCNYDTSGENQARYRVSKSAFKTVKVFLGNPASKAEYAPPVAASLKKNGMTNVRSEVHKGGSSLDYEQFKIGLKWFAE